MKRQPTSTRLTINTEKRIELLVKKTGQTKSMLVREMIESALPEFECSLLGGFARKADRFLSKNLYLPVMFVGVAAFAAGYALA